MSSFLSRFRGVAPALDGLSHKGQHGAVCVVGGSEAFSGAPFFAAMGALRSGSDLAYVLCERSCAPILKAYSPELMVFPTWAENDSETAQEALGEKLKLILPRVDAVVLGPGLGRSHAAACVAKTTLEQSISAGVALVVDADALFLWASNSWSFEPPPGSTTSPIVLTPNVVELGRFKGEGPAEVARNEKVVVLSKGKEDVVSDGRALESVGVGKCAKRCGGQGDVLAGVVGTFLGWTAGRRRARGEESGGGGGEGGGESGGGGGSGDMVDAAASAAYLTRVAADRAFAEKKRAMSALDIIAHVGSAVNDVIDEGKDGVK